MYNIIQLNDKELSELQIIAKDLGIKKADSFKKEDLVYKILDEQAIVGATKKVAADKAQRRTQRRQEKAFATCNSCQERRQGSFRSQGRRSCKDQRSYSCKDATTFQRGKYKQRKRDSRH